MNSEGIFSSQVSIFMELMFSDLKNLGKRIEEARTNDKITKKARLPISIDFLAPHPFKTGAMIVLNKHVQLLRDAGNRVRVFSYSPTPRWWVGDVKWTLVPMSESLSANADADLCVATIFDQIPEAVILNHRKTLLFEQGSEALFTWGSNNKMQTAIYLLPSMVSTVSKYAQNAIYKYGRSSYICPNGIESEYFFDDGKKKQQNLVVVVTNQDVELKRTDLAIESAIELRRRGFVTIIISNREISGFNDILNRFEIKNIVNPSRRRTGEIMRRASFMVHTSRYESFGLPPLEAMACGVSVVGTDSHGLMEYAKIGKSFFKTYADPYTIAEATVRASEISQEKRRKWAVDSASGFSWDEIGKKYVLPMYRLASAKNKPSIVDIRLMNVHAQTPPLNLEIRRRINTIGEDIPDEADYLFIEDGSVITPQIIGSTLGKKDDLKTLIKLKSD